MEVYNTKNTAGFTDTKEWSIIADCVIQFNSSFGALNAETAIRNNLDVLWQANPFAKLDAFITRFQMLALKSEYDKKALIHFFKQDICENCKEYIANQFPQPTTLKK